MILLHFFKLTLGLLLALAGMGCGAAQAPQSPQPPLPPRAMALKPTPPAVMSKAHIASLCKKLATPCNPETTQAWMGAPSSWASALFIDTSRPMLFALRPDGSLTAWDFSEYRHSRGAPDAAVRTALAIYPALYPASDSAYAIAVVREVNEGYSGGGAGFGYADFVVLESATRTPPAAKPYTLRYAGVPFSCSKMVRACFSEREYQTSRHCHDEWSGHLTIQFPSTRDNAGQWSFTWHETHWPAHVTQAHAKRTRARFTLPGGLPGAQPLPKGVGFCGGGPP